MSKYVQIAKRENNSKRGFLIVNPYLGKHVPMTPNEIFDCFNKVSELGPGHMNPQETLVIGFAETATALGIHYALINRTMFMQTTREKVDNASAYIYFSEEHSHATAQYIVKDDMDAVINRVEKIIFIDDEITTGKTILNAIAAIEREYDKKIKYEVISILNSMNDEQLADYAARDIGVYYLEKIQNDNYNVIADGYTIAPENYHVVSRKSSLSIAMNLPNIKLFTTRHLVDFSSVDIAEQYDIAAAKMMKDVNCTGHILVLGTEEFMYPGLLFARELEKQHGIKSVKFHATTRSPIAMSNDTNYPLHERYELRSLYEDDRTTYVYNLKKYDHVFVVTEWKYLQQTSFDGMMSLIKALKYVGNKAPTIIALGEKQAPISMMSTYHSNDVTILLKDITGKVKPESTMDREKKIQSGTHYCEMLPIEYVPSQEYEQTYNEMVEIYAEPVARAVEVLSEKILKTTNNPVLVSLARAGIPAGIMVKHYLSKKYKINVPHYAISIIRGRGIDKNAMNYIIKNHGKDNLIFVDGWTGKGAIKNQLVEALKGYEINPILAVIADPAGVSELYGTSDDLMIPSACLNSTISGLISRTFLRDDIIGPNDFHGAVYYKEMRSKDKSYDFIYQVENYFNYEETHEDNSERHIGIEDVKDIMKQYDIDDINLVKPGIGETTRVLLRRIPDLIVINEQYRDSADLRPILRLAQEKDVDVTYQPLKSYKVCGIIKKVADA